MQYYAINRTSVVHIIVFIMQRIKSANFHYAYLASTPVCTGLYDLVEYFVRLLCLFMAVTPL